MHVFNVRNAVYNNSKIWFTEREKCTLKHDRGHINHANTKKTFWEKNADGTREQI